MAQVRESLEGDLPAQVIPGQSRLTVSVFDITLRDLFNVNSYWRFVLMVWKHKRIFTLATVAAIIAALSPNLQAQSLDELHKNALKEGGALNFYGTLAQINAEKILPVFEKRFPGIKVNHIDATSDKLAARAITEARGGRVLADVFQLALENVLQVIEQKLTVDWLPPEAAAYPANFKGTNWLAADMVIITAAW